MTSLPQLFTVGTAAAGAASTAKVAAQSSGTEEFSEHVGSELADSGEERIDFSALLKGLLLESMMPEEFRHPFTNQKENEGGGTGSSHSSPAGQSTASGHAPASQTSGESAAPEQVLADGVRGETVNRPVPAALEKLLQGALISLSHESGVDEGVPSLALAATDGVVSAAVALTEWRAVTSQTGSVVVDAVTSGETALPPQLVAMLRGVRNLSVAHNVSRETPTPSPSPVVWQKSATVSQPQVVNNPVAAEGLVPTVAQGAGAPATGAQQALTSSAQLATSPNPQVFSQPLAPDLTGKAVDVSRMAASGQPAVGEADRAVSPSTIAGTSSAPHPSAPVQQAVASPSRQVPPQPIAGQLTILANQDMPAVVVDNRPPVPSPSPAPQMLNQSAVPSQAAGQSVGAQPSSAQQSVASSQQAVASPVPQAPTQPTVREQSPQPVGADSRKAASEPKLLASGIVPAQQTSPQPAAGQAIAPTWQSDSAASAYEGGRVATQGREQNANTSHQPSTITQHQTPAAQQPSPAPVTSSQVSAAAGVNAALPIAPPTAPAASASATSPAVPATPPAAVELARQVSATFGALRELKSGTHQLSIKVTPEEFGPIKVVARIEAGAVGIDLHTASATGRELLKVAMADIRRDLPPNIASATVTVSDNNSGQASGGFTNQQGTSQGSAAYDGRGGQRHEGNSASTPRQDADVNQSSQNLSPSPTTSYEGGFDVLT